MTRKGLPTSFRIDPEVKAGLERHAAAEDRSVSDAVE
jgi:Ribbon-helix-helix protein, copG family